MKLRHAANVTGSGAGYVYVLSYPGSDKVKIGHTNDMDRRARELGGGTIGPNDPIVEICIWCSEGREKVERLTHKHAHQHRHNGEWFAMTPSVALDAVRNAAQCLHVEHVIAFDRTEHEVQAERARVASAHAAARERKRAEAEAEREAVAERVEAIRARKAWEARDQEYQARKAQAAAEAKAQAERDAAAAAAAAAVQAERERIERHAAAVSDDRTAAILWAALCAFFVMLTIGAASQRNNPIAVLCCLVIVMWSAACLFQRVTVGKRAAFTQPEEGAL